MTQPYQYPSGERVQLLGAVFYGDCGERAATPDGEVADVGFFPSDSLPDLFPPNCPVIEDLLSGAAAPVIG